MILNIVLNQQLTSFSELLRTAGDQTNQLDIEAEMDNITVLDDVFLAFQAPLPGILAALFAFVLDEIFVAHHLGPNEAFFEIRVYHACCLRRRGAYADGPAQTGALLCGGKG